MELIGVVKTVNRTKGFGFITPDDKRIGNDVFFHRTTVPAALWESMEDRVTRVACTVVTAEKGLRATDVRPLNVADE